MHAACKLDPFGTVVRKLFFIYYFLMGKAKKRNFHNCIKGKSALPVSFSREAAVERIIARIKNNDLGPETRDIIGLFGISAEELSEAGASYEDLKVLNALFL